MRKLVLLHPLNSETEFIVGKNCDQIEPLDHGGYLIRRGQREDTVGAHRVDVFTNESRPGLIEAQPEQPPPGMKLWTDGLWHCNDCKYKSKTAHGVKTHRGMEHAGP